MARVEMRGMVGFGYDQIVTDHPVASETLVHAENWATRNLQSVDFRVMSPDLAGQDRTIIVAEPPLNPEKARNLGQHLCNMLGPVVVRTGKRDGAISTETLLPRHSDGTLVEEMQPDYVDLKFDTPDTDGRQFFTERATAR